MLAMSPDLDLQAVFLYVTSATRVLWLYAARTTAFGPSTTSASIGPTVCLKAVAT